MASMGGYNSVYAGQGSALISAQAQKDLQANQFMMSSASQMIGQLGAAGASMAGEGVLDKYDSIMGVAAKPGAMTLQKTKPAVPGDPPNPPSDKATLDPRQRDAASNTPVSSLPGVTESAKASISAGEAAGKMANIAMAGLAALAAIPVGGASLSLISALRGDTIFTAVQGASPTSTLNPGTSDQRK